MGYPSYLDAANNAAREVLGSLAAAEFTGIVPGFFSSRWVKYGASTKTFADFESYSWNVSDNGLSVIQMPAPYHVKRTGVKDVDDCDLDEYLILDGKPEEFYGEFYTGVREELVLNTIIGGYQKLEPERQSGRDWVIRYPTEARQIMRAIPRFYQAQLDLERIKSRQNLGEDERLKLIEHEMGLDLGKEHELDWCKELDSLFSVKYR